VTFRALVIAATAVVATRAVADAPQEAAIVIAPPADVPMIAARLEGHAFRTGDGVIVIDDIAGAGRPYTGVVERRPDGLWLRTQLGSLKLTGPLARPRIAGPGYRIWVVGHRDGSTLAAARIGILRRPVGHPGPL